MTFDQTTDVPLRSRDVSHQRGAQPHRRGVRDPRLRPATFCGSAEER